MRTPQDETSEDIKNTLVQESTFCDSKDLIYVSITAEEIAVMADVSDNERKEKTKKKLKMKKKSTKKKTAKATKGSDTEEVEVGSLSGKRNKKDSKKKLRKKEGDSEAKIEAEQKHKSKKKKKELTVKRSKKKSSKSTDNHDGEGQHTEVHLSGNVRSSHRVNVVVVADEGTIDPFDVPPDLYSDSSSSELVHPNDIAMNESSTYESHVTSSNIDHPEMGSFFIQGKTLLEMAQKLQQKEGDCEAVIEAERKRKSKKKKKELTVKMRKKKSSKSTDNDDRESQHTEAQPSGNVSSPHHVNVVVVADERTMDSFDFPPEIYSDSSSSELLHPDDIEMNEYSAYESQVASSSIDHPELGSFFIQGKTLLQGVTTVPNVGLIGLFANLACTLSLPPQAIPGSIAHMILHTSSDCSEGQSKL